jgi:hypothetical protein
MSAGRVFATSVGGTRGISERTSSFSVGFGCIFDAERELSVQLKTPEIVATAQTQQPNFLFNSTKCICSILFGEYKVASAKFRVTLFVVILRGCYRVFDSNFHTST